MTMTQTDPEQTTIDRDLFRKLTYALSTRERLILGWRYGFFGGKRTYRAIAKTLSLSPARCHEIETKALSRMFEIAFTRYRVFHYRTGPGLSKGDEYVRLDMQRRLLSKAGLNSLGHRTRTASGKSQWFIFQNEPDLELEQAYAELLQRRDRLN